MAVYGDVLSAFPEQFERFEYFEMKPKGTVGYYPRKSLGFVTGVFQYVKRAVFEQAGDTLSEIKVPTLWTRKKLSVGNWINSSGTALRIVKEYNWKKQGGFIAYELEEAATITDKQSGTSADFGGFYQ